MLYSTPVSTLRRNAVSSTSLPLPIQQEIEKTVRCAAPCALSTADSPLRVMHPIDKVPKSGPKLPPPRLGMITLYYVLTKLGLISDARGLASEKQELDALDESRQALFKERVEEIKKAQKDAQANKRWSVAKQIFYWALAFTGLITGIGLIVSGGALLAGSLMLAGGLLAVTNQIMMTTGAWEKIIEKLPGENPEKKKAVVFWMQMGITVLALVLAGGATTCAGYAQVGQMVGSLQQMSMAGMASGYSICMLGIAITQSRHKQKLAEIKRREKKLAEVEFIRTDIVDSMRRQAAIHQELMEGLGRWLENQQELFQSSQRAITGR